MIRSPPVTTRVVRAWRCNTMNERELQAIYSLLAWVAGEQDTAPETVRRITETVSASMMLPALARKDYDEVDPVPRRPAHR